MTQTHKKGAPLHTPVFSTPTTLPKIICDENFRLEALPAISARF
jgi:hypothetical protein